MRLLPGVILAVIAQLPLLAQSQSSNALIHGVVRNVKASSVTIGYYASAFDVVFSRTTLDSAPIRAGGRYAVAVHLAHPVEFYVKVGNDYITYQKYIAPGDTVRIDYRRRATQSETLIAGNHEAHNDVLAAFQEKFFTGPTHDEFQNSFRTMEPSAFAAYADRRLAEQLSFVRDAFGKHPPSDEFRTFVVGKIYYRCAYERLQYVWKHARAHKEPIEPAAWNGYYAFLDTMAMNTSAADMIPDYAYFVHEYLQNRYQRWADSMKVSGGTIDRLARNVDNLALAAARLQSPALDVAHLWCIESQMRYVDEAGGIDPTKYAARIAQVNKDLHELVQRFNAAAPDRPDARMLANEIAFRLALTPGSPAPDFTFSDMNGAPVSLWSLRGRPVYIDVWATNCAPCMHEMKTSVPQLQKRFGDSVTYLYVSFDPTEKAWRTFVSKGRVAGVHVRDPRGFGSALAQQFRISGIPHHILLDREGRIVSADAPGADDAEGTITTLLAPSR